MNKKVLICLFVFFSVFTIVITCIQKSYSYGIDYEVTGTKGSRTLKIYDASTGVEIDYDSAKTYYGVMNYELYVTTDGIAYFYRGKEIDKDTYTVGLSKEKADLRASEYGSNGIRVSTTTEFKNALDDIYKNHKIGSYYFEYSIYDDINFDEVNYYYKNTYAILEDSENFYNYTKKGNQEPIRFADDISKDKEEFYLETHNIRITSDEEKVANSFYNSIASYLIGDGTDYQKILRTYTYLKDNTTYFDDSVHTNQVDSYTSCFDGLISRKATCIGYSVTFSYIMDKMGIESYIVDNITELNPSSKQFRSTHTWNIVKLNGKFYKIDLTGGVFLGGLSSSELYKTINISTSSYGGNTNTDISSYYGTINNLLQSAKNVKTTTTKQSYATSTVKIYPNEIPNTKAPATTVKRTNSSGSSTSTVTQASINESTTVEGIVPNTDVISTSTTRTNIVTVASDPKTEDKKGVDSTSSNNNSFNWNYALIPSAVLLFALLVYYKIKKIKNGKMINIDSKNVCDVLNKDISIHDENNRMNILNDGGNNNEKEN